MALRVCPKCTSWRMQVVERDVFYSCLLQSLNLGFYYCQDCGWQGLGRLRKRSVNLIMKLQRVAVLRYIFFVVLTLSATAAVLALWFNPMALHGTKIETAIFNAPAVSASSHPNPEAPQKVKVIGNRDSRRYHLPGLKYYNQVAEYHRVVFSSEEEAIAAGYHKAPR